MSRRILVIVVAALTLSIMLVLSATSAFAQNPINQGTTNACAKHVENKGNSFAKGLECAKK